MAEFESDFDEDFEFETLSSNERSSVLKIEDEEVYILKRYYKRPLRRELLKRSRKNGAVRQEIDLLQNEIDNLKKLNHDNIIKLFETQETPTSVDLILEYGGIPVQDDTFHNSRDFTPLLLKSVLNQLINVLAYLHSFPILHCDLKPSNILISPSNLIKLCDFGSSIDLTRSSSDILEVSPRTTPSFTAPELYQYNHRDKTAQNVALHGKPLDVWALGVTFYCLVYEEHPFKIDGNIIQLYHSINNCEVELEDNSVIGVELLQRFIEKSPSRRITVEEMRLQKP